MASLHHSKVPLEVRGAKFMPGEIIASKQSKEEADVELGMPWRSWCTPRNLKSFTNTLALLNIRGGGFRGVR